MTIQPLRRILYMQALYVVVNDWGVRQIYTPVMWKIPIPPRLHIFLWLLANNKIFTRDNLAKRRNVKDGSCLFHNEKESVCHLFFYCCVARILWQMASTITGKSLGTDFELVAKSWFGDKKLRSWNVFTSAIFWTIWKTRNRCIGAVWYMCKNGCCMGDVQEW
jgi:hypothetical protein